MNLYSGVSNSLAHPFIFCFNSFLLRVLELYIEIVILMRCANYYKVAVVYSNKVMEYEMWHIYYLVQADGMGIIRSARYNST